MSTSRRLLLLTLSAALLFARASFAVTAGQRDSFGDGTTQDWFVGLDGIVSPKPPLNVATGGPDGAGDGYLLLTAVGGSGPASRLSVIHTGRWAGNYIAAGVTGIRMSLNNFGPTTLSVRLLFETSLRTPVAQAVSTQAISLPAGSGWVTVVFPVSASALTALGGSVNQALSGAGDLRIFHSPSVIAPGPPVVASLGVDDIVALPEPDADGDGVPDLDDDCSLTANPTQRDADHDGYGNLCDPDFDQSGVVNFLDLARMKSSFFSNDAVTDLDGSGAVNFVDLSILKRLFFHAPGPSGLACAGQIPCSAPSP